MMQEVESEKGEVHSIKSTRDTVEWDFFSSG